MFVIPSTAVHRCLKHQGTLGKGRDFISQTPCVIHIYSDSKQKFGLQVYENVTKQFNDLKISQLTPTIIRNSSPNITRVVGFSKYSHSNKLIDLSILYNLSDWYGLSLENIIRSKMKNNIAFKEEQMLDFLTQILDVVYYTGQHTSQYMCLTPVNIFATIDPKNGFSYFPNNFGIDLEGTKWEKLYHNPRDKFWKDRSKQNATSAVLFMIGMISLEMCTFQQSTTMYYQNSIDEKTLLKSLQSIKLSFSQSLYDLVSRLCSLEQENRITLSQIYDEESIITRHRRGKSTQQQIQGQSFKGLLRDGKPLGTCRVEGEHFTYTGGLNSEFRYQGYGVLVTKDEIWRGQFVSGQFLSGQYYQPDEYVMVSSSANKGCSLGFKIAVSGNKSFLYMSGLFGDQKQLLKGKTVHHNGKSVETDLMGSRQGPSRLTSLSVRLPRLQQQK